MTSQRILVVYDGPDILEALVTVLDDSGFQTSGAPGGCYAQQTFYEIQTQLVMLDLIKPMRSGVDVCRQIRSMLDARVVSLSCVEDVEFGKELLAPPPTAKQPQQTAPPGVLRRRSWQVRFYVDELPKYLVISEIEMPSEMRAFLFIAY